MDFLGKRAVLDGIVVVGLKVSVINCWKESKIVKVFLWICGQVLRQCYLVTPWLNHIVTHLFSSVDSPPLKDLFKIPTDVCLGLFWLLIADVLRFC